MKYNADCLFGQGSAGGPREDTLTGILVRAPQSEWRKGSVIAVDAGAHLASIIRILEQDMPMNSDTVPPPTYSKLLKNGPFAGIKFPHISAKANALFILRELLHSFLITHPHLDHLSAMAINTPALEYGREAKTIIALPSTIEAIKTHIFNDAIWPNLSDEGHGVGFVTYRRLIEGGNPRLGHGESRGYVNVCDGLASKCWSLSHGKCHRRSHSISHQRTDSFNFPHGDGYNPTNRRLSRVSDHDGYVTGFAHQQMQNQGAYPAQAGYPGTPGQTPVDRDHMFEPVSSSAFFIRNDVTGKEILILGDMEPDTVSMFPRNGVVWDDAASKFAKGILRAIFIECSYDDSVRNEDLYGHLCPRHLIAELKALAGRVMDHRELSADVATTQVEEFKRHPSHDLQMSQPPSPSEMRKKRKRDVNGESIQLPESQRPNLDSGLPNSVTNTPVTQLSKIPIPHTSPKSVAELTHPRHGIEKSAHIGAEEPKVEPLGPPLSPVARAQRNTRGLAGSVSSTASSASVPGSAPASVSAKPNLPPPAVAGIPTPATAAATTTPATKPPQKLPDPLKGLMVHIIHVKDNLADGPTAGEIILGQLRKQCEEVGLGCGFEVTSCGQSIWIA